ncbi:hypothetical protein C8F01DRAFT_1229052 [Mycena amicta]|nr:hypothetical protein C8F01DRAFT_1229052 [Mycena amicta]
MLHNWPIATELHCAGTGSQQMVPSRPITLLSAQSSIYMRPRVYNLRLLILSSAVSIALLATMSRGIAKWEVPEGYLPDALLKFLIPAFIGCSVVLLHHLVATLPWPKHGRILSVIDILAIVVEIGLIVPHVDFLRELSLLQGEIDAKSIADLPTLDPVVLFRASVAVELATLGLSLIFRTTTLTRNQGSGFLGGCRPVFPPYNVKSILLNRSIMRPLVRGESIFVIMFRAFIISCLAIIVPAFAAYSIILQPATAQVYLKTLIKDEVPAQFVLLEQSSTPSANGHLAFAVAPLNLQSQFVSVVESVMVMVNATSGGRNTACSATPQYEYIYVECPFGWSKVTLVQFSVNMPLNVTGITIVALPWSSRSGYARPGDLLPPEVDGDGGIIVQTIPFPNFYSGPNRITPILLLPNSRQFGLLWWIARQLHGSPLEYLYIPQIYNRQEDTALPLPRAPDDATSLASLRIGNAAQIYNQQEDIALPLPHAPDDATSLEGLRAVGDLNRIEVEVTDSSVLSAISKVGGFWTFVNGTFALFFGANIFYFAFGRRPLSALGVAHLFQRSSLARNWHEDFPALHTEGGLPGSDSAGIVAFIRERLVDLDRQAPKGPLAGKEGLSTLDPDTVQPTPKSSEIDRGSRTDPEEGSTSTLDLPVESEARLESLPANFLRTAGYILHDSPP